jgi:pathogenesis-related protein 1
MMKATPKKSSAAILLALFAAGCAPQRPPIKPPAAVKAVPKKGPVVNKGEIQSRILAAHNAWRKKVRVPPLQWSSSLARFAQQWADTLQGQGCNPEHRPANKYGENIEWAGGQNLTPEKVVELWGREEASYNYVANSCQAGKNCLHYTQLVWRSTTAVGCGVARCSNSEVWVCNYAPPGNWVGKKPY